MARLSSGMSTLSRESSKLIELNTSLLKSLREERHLMLSLVSLGFTPQQAYQLISDPLVGQAQTEDDAGDGVFDASDRLEGEDVITWWNDIEKDKRYSSWPSSLAGVRHEHRMPLTDSLCDRCILVNYTQSDKICGTSCWCWIYLRGQPWRRCRTLSAP